MARKSGSSFEKTAPKVRAAALSLFARHGYAAVSMRQIAAEVGVQAGALYRYTPDKQSLLFDLMKSHMDELLLAWDAADPGGAAQARLDAFVRFHIPYHLARVDAVFVSYMELRNLSPQNFDHLEGLRSRYEQALEDILKQGVSAGQFSLTDTRLSTLGILAMLTGVTTWYRAGGRLNPDEVAAQYVDMVGALTRA